MAAPGTREDLVDRVLDLQHDLGKYLALPLAYLPADAPPSEVHAALRQALLETRKGPAGTRAARLLWEEFLAAAGDRVRRAAAFGRLVDAVERALRWEVVAAEQAPEIDRERAQEDLSAVAPAIRAVAQELNGRA